MFNAYNERSCRFECRLRHAVNKTGCIPWDYPMPRSSSSPSPPLCTSSKNASENLLRAFEAAMSDNGAANACDCPPNCEEVNFKIQVCDAAAFKIGYSWTKRAN